MVPISRASRPTAIMHEASWTPRCVWNGLCQTTLRPRSVQMAYTVTRSIGGEPVSGALALLCSSNAINRRERSFTIMRMKTWLTSATCVAALTAIRCQALAQNSENAPNTADRKFVKAAAQSEMANVKLGELAGKNSASDSVKHFGKTIVDDHFRFNDELKRRAGRTGITLPTDLSTKRKAVIAKLEKLHGAAFDTAYLRDMQAEHSDQYMRFYMEMLKGHSLTIRAFAAINLDVIEKRGKLISGMEKMHGALKGRRSGNAKR